MSTKEAIDEALGELMCAVTVCLSGRELAQEKRAKDVIRGYIAELEKERDELKKKLGRFHPRGCWAVSETDDGVAVCFHEHDRDQPCEWNHYLDAERYAEITKRIESAPKVDLLMLDGRYCSASTEGGFSEAWEGYTIQTVHAVPVEPSEEDFIPEPMRIGDADALEKQMDEWSDNACEVCKGENEVDGAQCPGCCVEPSEEKEGGKGE